jgi:hypothetical protein
VKLYVSFLFFKQSILQNRLFKNNKILLHLLKEFKKLSHPEKTIQNRLFLPIDDFLIFSLFSFSIFYSRFKIFRETMKNKQQNKCSFAYFYGH